jgi:hypothetical protein
VPREIRSGKFKRSPKLILDYATNLEEACETTKEVFNTTEAELANARANARTLGPYAPRDSMAGDPGSPSGTKVALSELADDVLAAIASAQAGVRVYNETLTGPVNGINTTFTTSSNYVPNTEAVYFNGIRQLEGPTEDYVRFESGGLGTGFDAISFAIAPRSRPGSKSDDTVAIDYNPV